MVVIINGQDDEDDDKDDDCHNDDGRCNKMNDDNEYDIKIITRLIIMKGLENATTSDNIIKYNSTI